MVSYPRARSEMHGLVVMTAIELSQRHQLGPEDLSGNSYRCEVCQARMKARNILAAKKLPPHFQTWPGHKHDSNCTAATGFADLPPSFPSPTARQPPSRSTVSYPRRFIFPDEENAKETSATARSSASREPARSSAVSSIGPSSRRRRRTLVTRRFADLVKAWLDLERRYEHPNRIHEELTIRGRTMSYGHWFQRVETLTESTNGAIDPLIYHSRVFSVRLGKYGNYFINLCDRIALEEEGTARATIEAFQITTEQTEVLKDLLDKELRNLNVRCFIHGLPRHSWQSDVVQFDAVESGQYHVVVT